MQYLKIRNWEKYQDTAGRGTSFVKIQTAILTDMEFMCLPNEERLCFLLLLVYAGINSNKLPADPNHIMHLCHLDVTPNVTLMKEQGLITDWDEEEHNLMLEKHQHKLNKQNERKRRQREKEKSHAVCHADVTPPSQTETETETETKTINLCVEDSTPPSANGKDFERFWEHWPVKRNKQKAKQAFVRKKFMVDDVDELIKDVTLRLQKDPQWRCGYIPHCSTYLNGDRWEDEIHQEARR